MLNKNGAWATSAMGFSLEIPQRIKDLSYENREIAVRFQYQNSGAMVNAFYKWKTDKDESKHVIEANKPISNLSTRITRVEGVAQKPIHYVFVVDKSDSMGYDEDLENKAWPVWFKNEIRMVGQFQDSYRNDVGAIFVDGIIPLLQDRRQKLT